MVDELAAPEAMRLLEAAYQLTSLSMSRCGMSDFHGGQIFGVRRLWESWARRLQAPRHLLTLHTSRAHPQVLDHCKRLERLSLAGNYLQHFAATVRGWRCWPWPRV